MSNQFDLVDGKRGLNFSTSTRRLPLLIFWIFMGVAVLVAAGLAHSRTTWHGFWNQEAVFDRSKFLNSFPLGIGWTLDYLVTEANGLFIAGGWIIAAVVIVAVQAFYILLVDLRRSESIDCLRFLRQIRIQKLIAIEALVLGSGTLFFIFGTRIFYYVSERIGSCSLGDQFAFPVKKSACQGMFRGFDISGHCFLIVHSCLMAMEYAAKVIYLWTCSGDDKESSSGDKESDLESLTDSNSTSVAASEMNVIINSSFNRFRKPLHLALSLIFASIGLLCLVEFLIFLQTILFYHTVLEKILGTFFGAVYWLALFVASLKYPHLF